MSAYKIVHDRQGCIGCGACAAICDKFWEMDSDGKSKLKGGKPNGDKFELPIDDLGCNQDAADSCPVNVIHIVDTKTGKQLK